MKDKIKKVKTAVEASPEVSELRYRHLFETAQDGILIMDVNPYLIDMLGYAREEFMGKKL